MTAAQASQSVTTSDLAERFAEIRKLSEALVKPLSEADATLQSMEDASPAKWHIAHVTWFWETFLLRDHLDGYELFDNRFPFVFNSYYEAEGERMIKKAIRLLSGISYTPGRVGITEYIKHVKMSR